ncbi:MAG: DUF4407 domain-containing protein [Gammaproteobacteria bacterium]|nr:DUF4407 domain-containing protein [Gammaproteobacteria bacterium]MDH4316598.1 DUF4407 domain-containing protein [Gammaproteobacteria bacterium]MDH5215848.1 DUF4407 domain-containing protein [Gammaproteobacteria bacterium]
MMRFIPGFIGALTAYVALFFVGWLNNGWVHVAIFFGVYLFVTIAVDRGMSGYRKTSDSHSGKN